MKFGALIYGNPIAYFLPSLYFYFYSGPGNSLHKTLISSTNKAARVYSAMTSSAQYDVPKSRNYYLIPYESRQDYKGNFAPD